MESATSVEGSLSGADLVLAVTAYIAPRAPRNRGNRIYCLSLVRKQLLEKIAEGSTASTKERPRSMKASLSGTDLLGCSHGVRRHQDHRSAVIDFGVSRR